MVVVVVVVMALVVVVIIAATMCRLSTPGTGMCACHGKGANTRPEYAGSVVTKGGKQRNGNELNESLGLGLGGQDLNFASPA